MDWQRVLARIASEVEERADRIRDEVGRRLAPDRTVRVVPYRSYGTPDLVHVRARVLFGQAPTPSTPEDRWYVNLANAYRRIESDEVARARVLVSCLEAETTAETDEEGHLHASLAPVETPADDRLWHDARIRLLDPTGEDAVATVCIPARARFGVISDLDDTVVRTEAHNLVRVARDALFGNAHTRIPFPGVGAFYRALHTGPAGDRNPIFYVSSSPWNLYDVLTEFLRLHRIPAGPMELRDWGVTREEVLPSGHRAHKSAAIDRILETYPHLPFILVGDSGQEDPEIYRDAVRHHPDRIRAIYIRSVDPRPARIEAIGRLAAELGRTGPSELVLVEDTLAAARHAADHGWIDPAAVDAVARQRAEEG